MLRDSPAQQHRRELAGRVEGDVDREVAEFDVPAGGSSATTGSAAAQSHPCARPGSTRSFSRHEFGSQLPGCCGGRAKAKAQWPRRTEPERASDCRCIVASRGGEYRLLWQVRCGRDDEEAVSPQRTQGTRREEFRQDHKMDRISKKCVHPVIVTNVLSASSAFSAVSSIWRIRCPIPTTMVFEAAAFAARATQPPPQGQRNSVFQPPGARVPGRPASFWLR